MPAIAQHVGHESPVMVAVRGLPQQPEIAVGRLVQICGRHLLQPIQRLVERAPSGDAPPWLNHVAYEADTALHWLQNSLARIQRQAQVLEPAFD